MKQKSKSKVPETKGDCYQANGQQFLDICKRNKNPMLSYMMVHGVVTNQNDNKPMGHAWIEATISLGEASYIICLDFANNHAHSLTKETYYFIGKIDESLAMKYEYDEFNDKIIESGHWGNWDLNVNR